MKNWTNISLTQLGYLVAVDKHRNFREAAKESFVSQPTLSAQVQKVESHLGVLVFDRSKQPVVPTDMGKHIIENARAVLRQAAHLDEVLSQSKGILKGDYRLGIIPTLSSTLIPLFLEAFSKKYPQVNLYIAEQHTRDLIAKLNSEELDAAIAATPLNEPGLTYEPLFREPIYALISRNHRLAGRARVTEEDICPAETWFLSEDHCFSQQMRSLAQAARNKKPTEKPKDRNVHFMSGNFATLVSLVERGHGATLLPYLAAKQLKPSFKHSVLKRFTCPRPTREVSLIYRRAYLKEGITRAIQTEVLEALPKHLNEECGRDNYVICATAALNQDPDTARNFLNATPG